MEAIQQPNLIEINLSETTRNGGAGLKVGPTYLVLYSGRYYAGKFSQVWYGLNFEGIFDAGAQYDPPGTNYSSWQRIWRIENASQISRSAELEFKTSRRQHAIANKMTSNGQTIDETAPLDAFGYRPTIPAMPQLTDNDDELENDDD